MESDYHTGAQDGYKVGYERALNDVIEMIRDNFPDPNPLSSIFTPYIGDGIIEEIENMKG
ncbi:hypothetical protein SEA_ALONE_115 [Streptomyces phage Alone3]|nr:hypothetical protein SEA_ALONE_115 [Streptomyces phage Alone3]